MPDGLMGCEAQPEVEQLPPLDEEDPTRVNRHQFGDCSDDGRLTYYLVEEMEHVWPPYRGLLHGISATLSHQIDATETIWQFVQEHP